MSHFVFLLVFYCFLRIVLYLRWLGRPSPPPTPFCNSLRTGLIRIYDQYFSHRLGLRQRLESRTMTNAASDVSLIEERLGSLGVARSFVQYLVRYISKQPISHSGFDFLKEIRYLMGCNFSFPQWCN
jgi:hypothetical protein